MAIVNHLFYIERKFTVPGIILTLSRIHTVTTSVGLFLILGRRARAPAALVGWSSIKKCSTDLVQEL